MCVCVCVCACVRVCVRACVCACVKIIMQINTLKINAEAQQVIILNLILPCFRRIAYQEATQTFGVITVRIEIKDPDGRCTTPLHPSASTTAHNITSSATSAMTTNSTAGSTGGSSAVDGITFGDEVDVSSLLVIDQHTFEGKTELDWRIVLSYNLVILVIE